MRRHHFIVLALIVAAATLAFAAEPRGSWHIRSDEGKLHLDVSRRSNSHWGRTITREAFSGLTDAMLSATAETPATFDMVRDAGTIHFTGTFTDGDGVGRFTFTPNRNYQASLRGLGVAAGDDADDDDDLFSLAMHDVSIAFIREMQSLGYREDLDQYVAFRIHGVSPEFVRELRTLGYDKLDADNLVAFRIHGVSPKFVGEMKDLGVRGLTADDVVAMRIHGATTEFVRELRELGYSNLDSDDLIAMRIHGVSPRYIRELKAAGYSNIPVDKLVEMRIHGISADDVKRMK
ncbi:MAG: hypothetical protein AABO58_04105 [Acidobacteriota bacterium]